MNNVFVAVQQITLNTVNTSTKSVKTVRTVPLEAKNAVEGDVDHEIHPQQNQEQL